MNPVSHVPFLHSARTSTNNKAPPQYVKLIVSAPDFLFLFLISDPFPFHKPLSCQPGFQSLCLSIIIAFSCPAPVKIIAIILLKAMSTRPVPSVVAYLNEFMGFVNRTINIQLQRPPGPQDSVILDVIGFTTFRPDPDDHDLYSMPDVIQSFLSSNGSHRNLLIC